MLQAFQESVSCLESGVMSNVLYNNFLLWNTAAETIENDIWSMALLFMVILMDVYGDAAGSDSSFSSSSDQESVPTESSVLPSW